MGVRCLGKNRLVGEVGGIGYYTHASFAVGGGGYILVGFVDQHDYF